MGLDVEIEIRGPGVTQALLDAINERIDQYADTRFDDGIYNTFTFEDCPPDTARFQTLWRYWGPGYERGPWLNISSVIMVAIGQIEPDAHAVFYGHDCELQEHYRHVTPQFMTEMWAHYAGPKWNDYRR